MDRCLDLLETLREELEAGVLSVESHGWILKRIYGPPNQRHLDETLYDVYAEWCDTAEADQEEREENGYASPEECKKQVLLAIDFEIKRLNQYKEKLSKIEAKRMDIEGLRQSIPDSPGLDRLMRYETGLERAFDRTLTQLERIQRMRKGQLVPPPIKLDVSA